jgi:uncharacterized membrane protein YhfC
MAEKIYEKMTLLSITYFLNAVIMIAVGLVVGWVIVWRYHLPWRYFGVGAITFILSQVGHIPFNGLISGWLFPGGNPAADNLPGVLAVAVFVGLSSGFFEESARGLMYRFALKDARSWASGLLAGAGHGGIEAVIFGGLTLWAYLQAFALQGAPDLSAVVPAEQLADAQAFLAAYWSVPWYASLLGALERLLALPLHLALSVLVLQAFTRKQPWWWWAAVLWHALANGVAYTAMTLTGNAYLTEVLLAGFTLGSFAILRALWQPEPLPVNPVSSAPRPIEIRPVEETPEDLEKSKFQ